MYAGKTLAEIAGLSTYRTQWVLCRSRDKYGRLIRANGLPEHVQRTMDADGRRRVDERHNKPFSYIYKRTWMRRGKTKDEVEAMWADYCEQRREEMIAGRRRR